MDAEYEKKLREIKEWEKDREDRIKRERPYQPWRMNSERMPWGCWIWIALAALAVFFALQKSGLGL